ncbi:hypothetical protein Tco_1067039 [Tanacetum coccineum]|uniref:Uncharacterized protein n=1 Tax=Tanacetum coccineum TaxID=301880 RepID=A0ABQ5HBT2_9ASTR
MRNFILPHLNWRSRLRHNAFFAPWHGMIVKKRWYKDNEVSPNKQHLSIGGYRLGRWRAAQSTVEDEAASGDCQRSHPLNRQFSRPHPYRKSFLGTSTM